MDGRDENRFRVLRWAAQSLRNDQEKLLAIAAGLGLLLFMQRLPRERDVAAGLGLLLFM